MNESYVTGTVGGEDSFAVLIALEDEDDEPLDEMRIRFWSKGAWRTTLDIDFKAVDVAPNGRDSFAVLGMEGEVLWIDNAFSDRITTREDMIGGGTLASRTAIVPFAGGLAATGMGRQVHWSNGGPWQLLGSGVGDEKGKLVGFEALCATDESTLYAAGWRGELWYLEKNVWQQTDSSTNLILTGLTATTTGEVVYSCGRQGILLRGNKNVWSVVDHAATEEDFWSVEYFRERIYLSSLLSIYVLDGDSLERVDDGSEAGSYYHLSANDDIMLSVGAAAILLFDGDEWLELT